ncbi:MAG: translocation/assembly module TamB domain-containing protein [Gemmatimonadota bacterium]|nr:translocation/assembly module TamB domain-containing protein [Gemmatimonadota bacterium]MDQ8171482.1 translocation/assembly module TamB domain-containing protein [Gemmatimonadota bacterium]
MLPTMSARQRRFWWVAAILLGAGGGVTLAYLLATGTARGRRWVLSAAISGTNGVLNGRGSLRVGVLREVGLGRIVAEQVSLVDTAGVPMVSAESLDGSLDVRALFDRAIHIRRLSVRGLRLDLRKDDAGPWNIAYLIAGDTVTRPRGAPGFGDDVRLDSLVVDDVRITTIAPWAPHPVFTGAARDSVIAVRDSLHDLVPGPAGGWRERRLITLDRVRAHDAVIVDAQRRPASVQLDSLRGVISDPPVRVVQAGGQLRWTSDSLQLVLPDVQLPASHGRVTGTVAWNQPGPLRYDVVVAADAGLSDLGWIWDVLPTDGRGTATVRMRTLENPDDVAFSLSALDVASGASRITGDIEVVLEPAVMRLQGVDLAFVPLESALLRRLSYDALPAEIRGVFTGTLVAKQGGPLSDFRMDRLAARFTDARVRGGAVSSVALAGSVSIGDRPRATNMTVTDARLDLRSVQALPPSLVPPLPAVDGIVTARGRIRLADLTAIDLADLALTWRDGTGTESTVRGDLRARFGGAFARTPEVHAALQFAPLAMGTLARIDTTLPVRGTLAGRVTVDGRTDALVWSASLQAVDDAPGGPAAGTVADTAGGAPANTVAMRGTAALNGTVWQLAADGTLNRFDLRRWMGSPTVPHTALDGPWRFALRGDRAAAEPGAATPVATPPVPLTGTMALGWQQRAGRDYPAFDLTGAASLGADRLVVDSAIAHLGGVTLDVHGALARDAGGLDTLQLAVRADSLGALRTELARVAAMLAPVDSTAAAAVRALAVDSLAGDLSLSGYLYGSLADAGATAALGASAVRVGAVQVGGLFGSVQADHVFTRPTFEGAATADDVDGLGAIRLQSVAFRVADANPDSGRLTLDVSSARDAHLVARGAFQRAPSRLAVALDSLRLSYADVVWQSAQPIVVQQDSLGLRLLPLELRSNAAGILQASADIPRDRAVTGTLRLEQFPVGEIAALLAGTTPFQGTVSGTAQLDGVRLAPRLAWTLRADSLGIPGLRVPTINATGSYADRRLVAEAVLRDSLGGALRAEARVPIDLALTSVEKRLLSDQVNAALTADSLRLEGLPLALTGVRRLRGRLSGQLAIGGTVDHPVARGTMTADGVGALIDDLGIEPVGGRVVLRAAEDSLILESLRVQSGGVLDTIAASGALHFHAGEPSTIALRVSASNVALSRQRDGTDLDLSGAVRLEGSLTRPVLSGAITIPRANLVADPLSAQSALDLSSNAARALLGADEVPVAETAAQSLAALGALLTVQNARVDLGADVWVQTPESRVNIAGGLAIAMSGERLALDGEVTANRGQYRLDLGVVSRSFSVDSGRVRFYGSSEIAPTLDISATNVVRIAGGGAVPVRVHIGGTYDVPVLTLSSTDPLYASAPESEIISLLIFGAPTFALDGQSQSTVRAVTGVLLPSVGGAVEGALQRLLPGVNTIQVSTAGGQSTQDLGAFSLLDNLSISAGKQLGPRTFLRLNTGVCRGGTTSLRGASLWAGIAAEYRFARNLSGQIGVDPGASPCTQLGTNGFPRLQFGFDLFREWIF